MRSLLLAAALLSGQVPAATAQSARSAERNSNRTMVHSIEIRASAKDVYRALTTPEGWRRWAVGVAWEVQRHPRIIETSYDPRAMPGGPATIRQLFVREEPYRLVEFRTIKAPRGFDGFDTYRNVINRLELRSVGPHRTRLRFIAGPFPDTATGRKLFRFFDSGNRKTLENMAEVLGRGAQSRFQAEQ